MSTTNERVSLKRGLDEVRNMAGRMRATAIELGGIVGREGKGVHFGGSLSAIEIMATLYGAVMNYDSKHMNSDSRDRLFVGKAHCILAHLPALEEMGIISRDELLHFREDGNPLLGYPRNLSLGLEYNGGSLGTAFSYAIGVALGYKRHNAPNHVYVLIGDGECDEGVIWETIMAASKLQLDNVTLVIDRNHLQLEGETESILPLDDLSMKLDAFGWEVACADGHDVASLFEALSRKGDGVPYAVIANTIKGKGVSFMEGNPVWHQGKLSQEDYSKAIAELGDASND